MMGPSHRLVGASSGVLVGLGVGLPAWQTACLTGASWLAGKGPDQAELGGLLAHRRLTHSPVAIAMLGLGAFVVLLLVASRVPEVRAALDVGQATLVLAWPIAGAGIAGLALGYASHLVADSCTIDGTRPGYPFTDRQVWVLPRRLRFRTGSSAEYRVVLSLAALTLLLLALSW
jgi:membrane-bound metal-dependent hydrolase YbcI (DUF457 family)